MMSAHVQQPALKNREDPYLFVKVQCVVDKQGHGLSLLHKKAMIGFGETLGPIFL